MEPRHKERRICVLGGGIMGSALAIFLARRGARVTVVDEGPEPLSGVSRWNEGKIHLGYLYAGDASLATAGKVLPGGLAFGPLMEELTGSSIRDVVTAEDDIFLTHRRSVVSAEAMGKYFAAVSDLVRDHPEAGRYLAGLSEAEPRQLTAAELAAVSGSPDIVAGFRVPERSVMTSRVADRLLGAMRAEPGIELLPGRQVLGVARGDRRWQIRCDPPLADEFDIVVNALWHGQAAIDASIGLDAGEARSYRYRLSLFLKTSHEVEAPSVVIATGPFGDVKNYDRRHFYLSWYPAGLLASSRDLPEGSFRPRDPETPRRVERATFAGLTGLLPWIANIEAAAAQVEIGGGWVVAKGQGSIADPASTLHRRDRFGVVRHGSYLSIDTGKYSTAPWLAKQIARELMTGD